MSIELEYTLSVKASYSVMFLGYKYNQNRRCYPSCLWYILCKRYNGVSEELQTLLIRPFILIKFILETNLLTRENWVSYKWKNWKFFETYFKNKCNLSPQPILVSLSVRRTFGSITLSSDRYLTRISPISSRGKM